MIYRVEITGKYAVEITVDADSPDEARQVAPLIAGRKRLCQIKSVHIDTISVEERPLTGDSNGPR